CRWRGLRLTRLAAIRAPIRSLMATLARLRLASPAAGEVVIGAVVGVEEDPELDGGTLERVGLGVLEVVLAVPRLDGGDAHAVPRAEAGDGQGANHDQRGRRVGLAALDDAIPVGEL